MTWLEASLMRYGCSAVHSSSSSSSHSHIKTVSTVIRHFSVKRCQTRFRMDVSTLQWFYHNKVPKTPMNVVECGTSNQILELQLSVFATVPPQHSCCQTHCSRTWWRSAASGHLVRAGFHGTRSQSALVHTKTGKDAEIISTSIYQSVLCPSGVWA